MKDTKKKRAFGLALDDLMETYGMVDYAVVAKTVTGRIDATWIAGMGDDSISDRERADVLYSEMERLQMDILLRTMPSQVKKTAEA